MNWPGWLEPSWWATRLRPRLHRNPRRPRSRRRRRPRPRPGPATPPPTAAQDGVQRISMMESIYPAYFRPDRITVKRGLPVELVISTEQAEHVNRISVLPWVESSDVVFPARPVTIRFTPDQIGEFKIRNIGHGFEATLVVTEMKTFRRQHRGAGLACRSRLLSSNSRRARRAGAGLSGLAGHQVAPKHGRDRFGR